MEQNEMERKESRAEEMGLLMGWEYSVESLGESKRSVKWKAWAAGGGGEKALSKKHEAKEDG